MKKLIIYTVLAGFTVFGANAEESLRDKFPTNAQAYSLIERAYAIGCIAAKRGESVHSYADKFQKKEKFSSIVFDFRKYMIKGYQIGKEIDDADCKGYASDFIEQMKEEDSVAGGIQYATVESFN